jgi:hypothetical protein
LTLFSGQPAFDILHQADIAAFTRRQRRLFTKRFRFSPFRLRRFMFSPFRGHAAWLSLCRFTSGFFCLFLHFLLRFLRLLRHEYVSQAIRVSEGRHISLRFSEITLRCLPIGFTPCRHCHITRAPRLTNTMMP